MSSYYSIFFLSSLCLFLSKKADLVLSYLQYAVPFSMNPGVYGNTVWPQKPVFGCSSCPLKKKKKSTVLDSSVRLGTVETAWLDTADWSHTTPYPWALRHSWLILWSTTCQKIVKKWPTSFSRAQSDPKWTINGLADQQKTDLCGYFENGFMLWMPNIDLVFVTYDNVDEYLRFLSQIKTCEHITLGWSS